MSANNEKIEQYSQWIEHRKDEECKTRTEEKKQIEKKYHVNKNKTCAETKIQRLESEWKQQEIVQFNTHNG